MGLPSPPSTGSAWSAKALWAIARAHVRKLVDAGPKGWLALLYVMAAACWLALVRQIAALRPRAKTPPLECDVHALSNPSSTCAAA